MTPLEFIQLCGAGYLSPIAGRAMVTLLMPFRHLNCEDVWYRTVQGRAALQTIKLRGEFGPDKTVLLEIQIPVSGVARTTLTYQPKVGEPVTETFNFNPGTEADMAGWVSVVLSTIREHCPPKKRNGGYFLE